jgi:RNA recognition motif-containing protein
MTYGFVKFKFHNDAEKAMRELNGREIDGKRIKVSYARRGLDSTQSKIFVKRIPPQYTFEDVHRLFLPVPILFLSLSLSHSLFLSLSLFHTLSVSLSVSLSAPSSSHLTDSQFGEIIETRLLLDEKGKSRQIAFIQYAFRQEAETGQNPPLSLSLSPSASLSPPHPL